MKNFKWFLLLFLLWGSSSSFAEVCQSPLAYLKVETPEHLSVNGQLNVTLKLHFMDSAIVGSEIGLTLPAGWSTLGVSPAPIGQIFKDSDEVTFTFQINYPVANLPYYPKEIPINIILSHATDSIYDSVSVQTTAHIYFTPYNTVEVMDMSEYYHPLRKWLHTAEGEEEPERIFVARESIPQSNIPEGFTVEEEWQNDFQLTFVPGLAYAIPMMPIHPDSIAAMSGGLNKMGYHYIGSVQGTIRGRFRHDPTGNMEHHRPLNGLKVCVYTYNVINKLGIKIGEGVTDVNGFFICNINTNLAFSERSIFLKVFSQINEFDIQATSMPFANTEYEVFGETLTLVYNNGNPSPPLNTSLIIRSNHLQAVHLAGQAFRFCNARSGRTLENGLRIRAYTLSTMFVPNWVNGRTGLSIFGNIIAKAFLPGLIYTGGLPKPTIFLHNGDAHDENTVYHEFGHFVMWQLQNKRWVNPLTGSFAKHGYQEEYNTQIAWTEGWADGFMSMTDGFYFNQDNEMNIDESGWDHERPSNVSTFTPRTINIMGNPITFTVNNVNNGVRSEYYISATLLDLWDGADKYDPFGNITSRTQLFTNTTPPTLVAYPDGENPILGSTPNWDNVSLTFQELCNVVADGTNGNVHENIQDFYHRLIRDKVCDERREIRNIFNENRIQWDIRNFRGEQAPFSTDEISGIRSYSMPVNGSTVTINHEVDVNRLNNNFNNGNWANAPSFNVTATAANQTKFLSDDLEVINGAFISFNRNLRGGFQNLVNWWPAAPFPIQSSRLFEDICSGTTLNIHNGGTLEVGDREEFAWSDVRVKNGSTITVGGPGETNPATLRINNNSRLIIEPGGRLVIFPNAQIILDGDNAILDIQGTLRIEDNATFTFTTAPERLFGTPRFGISGFVRFTPPAGGGGNIQTNGRGSGASFQLLGMVSHTDRVLEVTSGILSDGGCDLFTLQVGRAVLGTDARISVACTLSINYFTITSTTGVQNNHRGLEIWGQGHWLGSQPESDVNTNDLRISFGNVGITANQFIAGQTFGATIDNVRIENCSTGVASEGSYLIFEDTEIKNCGFGWQANNMDAGNLINLSVFKNCTNTAAINFTGRAGSGLTLIQSRISNNSHSGVWAKTTTTAAKCSKVMFNYENGFKIDNGILDMSTGTIFGNVDMNGNNRSINMDNQNFPGGTFYLKNGKNNFVYPWANNEPIIATLSHCPSLVPIQADKNQWPYITPNGVPAIVTAYNGIGGPLCSSSPVPVSDPSPIVFNQDCYVNTLGKNDSYSPLDNGKIFSLDTLLNLEYLRVSDRLLGDTNFVLAFTELKSLFYSARVAEQETNRQLLINIYYDMMKAVSKGINNREISPALAGTLAEMIDAQNFLLRKIPFTDENYAYHYRINSDKADMFALAGIRNTSMSLLDAMRSWVKEKDLKEVQYKHCLYNAEEMVISGKVPKEDFINLIEICQTEYYNNSTENNENFDTLNAQPQGDFQIYPNPVLNQLTIEIQSDEIAFASIDVKDVNSKTILSLIDCSKLQKGNNKLYLPTHALSSGIYLLQVFTNNKYFAQKFVVIH